MPSPIKFWQRLETFQIFQTSFMPCGRNKITLLHFQIAAGKELDPVIQ